MLVRRLGLSALLVATLSVSQARSAPSTEGASLDQLVDRMIQVAWMQEQVGPAPAIQPELPVQPELPQTSPAQSLAANTGSSIDTDLFNIDLPDVDFGNPGNTKQVLTALPVDRIAAFGGAASGPSNVVLGSEATVRATTDAGDLLGSSFSNTGVYIRQESPIVNQTRVRGFRYDQIRVTSSGAAWFPIRPDFDTPLSRFDSSIVRDVVIVKGPYAVRNGPGFAFIDVALADTPRYDCPDWGGFTKFLYNENGDQWYARQSFQGGDSTSGWRIGYGHAGGIDYEAGDGSLIGASYKARDLDFAYGWDLNRFASLEFNYLRNDLTDVQLPGQVNDFDFLKSDGFSLRYTLRDQDRFDLLTVHGWHNQSAYVGTALNKAPNGGNFPGGFPTLNDLSPPVSIVTEGDNSSSGVRSAVSWFGQGNDQLTIGTDYTHVRQNYAQGNIGLETFPPVAGTPFGGPIDFGVPLAKQDDFGVFADTSLSASEFVTIRAGTRLDWIDSTARPIVTPKPLDPRGDSIINPGPNPDQSFSLAAAYLTGEVMLTDIWTADVGAGYAERAPSPTELYTESQFLNILQQGGRVDPQGNNLLDKEGLFQIDAGLSGSYACLDIGFRGYHAWINDFITLRPGPPLPEDIIVGSPFGPPIFTNTQARTWGAESYFNYHITNLVSTFGTLSYTEGYDDTAGVPLWGIAPLETVFGLRWEGLAGPRDPAPWGFEYSVRIVSSQDRLSQGPLAVRVRGGSIDEEQFTPAFTLHNIRGYYRVNRAVSLVGGIENLGDTLYREHLSSITDLSGGRRASQGGALNGGVLGRGRNFYVGIQSRY